MFDKGFGQDYLAKIDMTAGFTFFVLQGGKNHRAEAASRAVGFLSGPLKKFQRIIAIVIGIVKPSFDAQGRNAD